MRIGVNLLYIRPGRVGGSEVYVRSLLGTMASMIDERIIVFCSAETAASFEPDSRLEIVQVMAGSFSQAQRLWAENWRLRSLVSAHRIDVLFSPSNFAATLLPSPVPQVATVYDFQHLRFPSNFSMNQRIARAVLFPMTFGRCRRIITISEFTRKELIHHYGVAPHRAVAIPLGFDAPTRPLPAQITAVKQRYALASSYVVYPAAAVPHKNHVMLVEAFARARRSLNIDVELVLTGAKQPPFDHIAAKAKEFGVGDSVRVLGYVDRADLFPIIAGATALVFPSRFEGFGLPLLEAMHLEVPVISSDAASLAEVAGDGALLLSPDDVEAWAHAIARITTDGVLRAQLVEAGRRNTPRFSWDLCARETLRVLRDAASDTGSGVFLGALTAPFRRRSR